MAAVKISCGTLKFPVKARQVGHVIDSNDRSDIQHCNQQQIS
jgi:hypothetical protein